MTDLQLRRSAMLADQLDAQEVALAAMVTPAINELFSAIGNSSDGATRASLLSVKRDLYNGRDIAKGMRRLPAARVPKHLRILLKQIAVTQSGLHRVAIESESAFRQEYEGFRGTLRRAVRDRQFASGLLLASQDLFAARNKLGDETKQSTHGRIASREELAIGRYLVRAATRTTPFAGFGAVSLIRLPGEDDDARGTSPRAANSPLVWHCAPQVHVGLLERWLRKYMADAWVEFPLTTTPFKTVRNEAESIIVFASEARRLLLAIDAPPPAAVEPAGPVELVLALKMSPLVRWLMSAADGRSVSQVVSKAHAERLPDLLPLIAYLAGVGFFQPLLPRIQVDVRGLGELADECGAHGRPKVAKALRGMRRQLERYRTARPTTRGRLLRGISSELEARQYRSAVYDDVVLEGLSFESLGIDGSSLLSDLAPILSLAQASWSNLPHQLMREAFIAQYGEEGACEDVPGFLMGLLTDKRFMVRLRQPGPRPTWMDSDLAAAVGAAEGERAELAPELFSKLPPAGQPSAISIFLQVAPGRPGAGATSYRLVLNGVQSGRYKYLSRYLAVDCPTVKAALDDARASFASPDSSDRRIVPVDIRTMRGHNFQYYPRLTDWTLEIPGEVSDQADRVLSLADLTLKLDQSNHQLRAHCRRIAKDIDPIYLGSLRDPALPDSLLLLRALSPNIGDELLRERVALYWAMDQFDVGTGSLLRPFRPRLEVGRLVLERARWAIAIEEIPRSLSGEVSLASLRRIRKWWSQRGLPDRCFVRRFDPSLPHSGRSHPAYVDWRSPLTWSQFDRLASHVTRVGTKRSGWLLFTEVLPACEDATLMLNSHAHVAELLVQCRFKA